MKKWDAQLYNNKHAFVSDYGLDLITLLEPQKVETILDLGCGTGTLTREISQHVQDVTGIDSSPEMIAKAKSSYPHINFQVADGQDFHLPQKFDAVFSNAALHWMTEPEKVIACVREALKENGRFVAEFGGRGNVEKIIHAIAENFSDSASRQESLVNYFPSIGEYSSLLEAHGFRVTHAFHFDRPTLLADGEAGLRHWIQMFRGFILEGYSLEEQEKRLAQVEEKARGELFKDGDWYADYKRLRIKAVKI